MVTQAGYISYDDVVYLHEEELDLAKAEIKNDRLFIPITAVFQMLNIPEEDITWIEKGKNVSVLY